MIGSEWTWQNWILCQSSHVTMSKKPSCLTWVHQKDPAKRWSLYWLNWALLSKLRSVTTRKCMGERWLLWQALHFDPIEKKKKLFYKLRMLVFPSRWTAKRKAIDYLAVMYVRCFQYQKQCSQIYGYFDLHFPFRKLFHQSERLRALLSFELMPFFMNFQVALV